MQTLQVPKKAFFVFILLLSFYSSFSQKTAIYTDAEADYRKGVELFEQKKFGAAQKKFELVINEFANAADKNQNTVINAAYYRAVCAYELSQPQAEQYFLSLLNDYGETPTTHLAYYNLGNIYYANKKYDKALTWYKQVDIYDLSAEEASSFKFQIAYCYFYKQQFDKAKPYFEEIKTVKNKYYYPANYYYGYLSYLDKNYEAALNSFNLIKESSLYAPIVPYYITQIYFLKGGYDDVLLYAVPLLNRTDLKYTNEIRQLVGKSYFNTGEYGEALPYLKEFYDKAQQSSKSDIYQIAFCEYKLKKYNDAIVHFLQLNTLQDSIGQNSQYLLADCYLKTNNKTSARNAFLNASKLDFDQKIKEVSMYSYAKLSFELGYQDVAISSFQDYINTFPSSPNTLEAKEYIAQLFLSTNNYRDALTIIRGIPNKSPGLKKAYQTIAFNRAIELFNDKDRNLDEADQLFGESLNNPIDKSLEADAYFWKGEIAFEQKDYKDAVTEYLKYTELFKQSGNSPSGASMLKANYGIGYAYLKMNNFTSAVTYFNEAKSLLPSFAGDKEAKARLTNDVYLRSGDCHFVLKQYEAATAEYKEVESTHGSSADYALFQMGILLGLQGKDAEKIKTLQQINNGYPSSIYLDDALFETGDTYFNDGNTESATLIFNRLLNDFPTSSYQKRAHLKLGQIYLNTKHYDNALDEYKIILTKYPQTQEAKEAMDPIKQVFIAKGDADGYSDFLKGLNIKVEASTKDSVVYLAAEQLFTDEKYDKAMQAFTDYLNSYPNGLFALSAHYYRAECYMESKDYDHALEDYEVVAGKTSNLYMEKAVLKAARINYSIKKDYAAALKYYKQLGEIADYKSNTLEALKGIMYSAYKIGQAEDVKSAAGKIIASDLAKNEDIAEAHYYLAKVALEAKDYTTAYNEFKKVSQLTTSEISAESLYSMALIQFTQHDLKGAEEQANKVPKLKPTYDYWIAKSYILLSDIYVEQEDLFNAKATLESIIANYKGDDDIVPTAKEKLNAVVAKENAASKLMEDSVHAPSDTLRMDIMDNGTLTPPDTLSNPK